MSRTNICAECGEQFDLTPNEKRSTALLCPECRQEFCTVTIDDDDVLIFKIVRKVS